MMQSLPNAIDKNKRISAYTECSVNYRQRMRGYGHHVEDLRVAMGVSVAN